MEDISEVISARYRLKECKNIGNREKTISCIYKTLHEITRAQDIVNLTLREVIDDDKDLRWIPIQIVDNANAIILGISDHKGNPKFITQSGGYVEEKINSLVNNWNALRLRHRRND